MLASPCRGERMAVLHFHSDFFHVVLEGGQSGHADSEGLRKGFRYTSSLKPLPNRFLRKKGIPP